MLVVYAMVWVTGIDCENSHVSSFPLNALRFNGRNFGRQEAVVSSGYQVHMQTCVVFHRL